MSRPQSPRPERAERLRSLSGTNEVNVNICIPTQDNQGLDSTVCTHFGSAPFFVIVDSESGAWHCVANSHPHHGGGACHPLAAFQDHDIHAVVVGGMGRRALETLAERGIVPLFAAHPTVKETLAAFTQGELVPITPAQACGAHAGSHGRHGHGHGGCCG
jgi:predicted Fe-Mo cluster-binding NifX family protein